MAGKGGYIPGSGRKKGSINKKRRELQELISDNDISKALLLLKNKVKEGDTDSAKYLLDQFYGKARQRTDLSFENGIEIIIKDFTDDKNS